MKILIATLYQAKFGMGGAERVALDLAYAMRGLFQDEVKVCINPGDAAEELRKNGVEVIEIPFEKRRTLETFSTLNQVMRSFRPDIMHSHHRYVTFLADIFLKRQCVVLHTEEVLSRDKRLFFRYGDMAAACHESVRQNLIRLYRVPAERVVTILNSVSFQSAAPGQLAEIRGKYPSKPGQVTGLCIARMEEQKGHRYLIDAAAMLPESYRKRLRIFLAGEGALMQTVRDRVKRLGLGDVFTFLGYCRQTSAFLEFCDFTVLSSIWEGSPLTILLSFAAGKPVLATDIDGIRGQVVPGRTGLLVPPGDFRQMANALMEMMDSVDNRLAMGREAAKAWAAYPSVDETARSYRRLYQQLTAAETPRASLRGIENK